MDITDLEVPKGLEPVVSAVKKILRGRELMAEGIKELEHLGLSPSVLKNKTTQAQELAKPLKRKYKKRAEKKDEGPVLELSAKWQAYAQDEERQKKLMDAIKASDWNGVCSLAKAVGYSAEGVRYLLQELKRKKMVKEVKKTGNPNHSETVRGQVFTYWEAR